MSYQTQNINKEIKIIKKELNKNVGAENTTKVEDSRRMGQM